MKQHEVQVRELAGWGLDDYEYRPQANTETDRSRATGLVASRSPFQQRDAVLAEETSELQDEFLRRSSRQDLLDEMDGLDWSLGVVDLRALIAFQRRVSFGLDSPLLAVPAARDWPSLLSHCFGAAKPVGCELHSEEAPETLVLRSSNPNLHVRTSFDAARPLSIHAGGPFFEVACWHGRWFLRDGYHRAYKLLQAGVFEVPAIVVQARTIEELGADRPWFFSEETLFSETPPLVTDFLNDELVLTYSRPALHKTIRITIEEFLTPVAF